MMTCEHLRAQLLGYLYDLLDDAEKQEADAHLAGCEGCQAALTAARRQQRLLAAAAKSAFPDVQFERPKSSPVETVALPRLKKSFPTRFHFALAATFLIAAGLGLPGAWFAWSGQTLESRLREGQVALTEANTRLNNVVHERLMEVKRLETAVADKRQAVVELQKEEEGKWRALGRRVADQQLQLSIIGPESLQAGAENDYVVRTRNLQNEELKAQLSAKVVDQTGKVFFEVKDIPTLGDYRLHLPADMPVTPGSQLALDLVAKKDGQPDRTLRQKISLAAPIYLTHLATDKPMYRPGETVHYRSLTLERFSLKPVEAELSLQFAIHGPRGDEIFKQTGAARLRMPNGAVLSMANGKPVSGVGAGEFQLPPGLAGGEYTLKVSETNNRFPEQERKFIVNNFANPRLNKELDFTRKSYGPGQEVVAACSAMRAEGGPVANRPVLASMFIDGKAYGPDGKEGAKSLALQTDALGRVNVRFKLPDFIQRGQASLTVQVDDGGNVEPLVRTVPIALKKLQVDFFPEGGDLIAGGPNRVYFQARTTLDKPAELKGHIVDDKGTTVAPMVSTLHDDAKPGVNQGMGRFAFTPVSGRHYQLKIDEPAGMEGVYSLPEVRDEGVLLQVGQPAKDSLPVQVTSMEKDRNLLIGVYCRGRLLDSKSMVARKGFATTVEMKPALPTGGVFRVTVFEELPPGSDTRLRARAERLVYREPANILTLSAKLDRERYVPGDRVKAKLSSERAKKEVAGTVAMAAVVDKSVLTLADEKTFHGMPTHYYLTSEIRRPEDLEFADFLVSQDSKAPEVLDLLLGTQGWRRFAEQNPEDFRKKNKEDADRLMLVTGQAEPVEVDMARQEARNLREAYASRLGTLESERKVSERALAELQRPNNPLQVQLNEANQAVAIAKTQVDEAMSASRNHWKMLEPDGGTVLVLGLVLLVGLLAYRLATSKRSLRVSMGIIAGIGVVALCASIPFFQAERARGLLGGKNRHNFDNVAAEVGAAKLAAPAPVMEERLEGVVRALEPEDKNRVLFDPAPGNIPASSPATRKMGEVTQLKAAPDAVHAPKVDGQALSKLREPPLTKSAPAAVPPAPTAPAGAVNQLDDVLKRGSVPLSEASKSKSIALGSAGDASKVRDQKQDAAAATPPAPGVAALKENLDRGAPARENKHEYKKDDAYRDRESPPAARFDAGSADKKAEKQAKTAEPRALDARSGGFGRREIAPGQQPVAAKPSTANPQVGLGITGNKAGMGGGGRGGMGMGGPAGGGGMPGPGMAMGGRFVQPGFNFNDPPVSPAPEPMVVRQYAHVRPPELSTGERIDFVDTVYWHPALVLPDGTVEFEFQLGDAVTSYQLLVFAHTPEGNLGSLTKTFEARLPFTLEPKLPLEVTAGDRIDLPVSVANNTPEVRAVQMQLEASNMKLSSTNSASESASLDLAADARGRRLFAMQPAIVEGEAVLTLEGRSGAFRDRVVRRIPIVPQGFPVVLARSDMLEKTARQELVLPEAWIPGTLRCQVQVYPSTLAALQQGLEGLLREPNGCFEQTSTTNYPNLLILDYLRENNQTRPELEKRVRDLLANGYAKLTSFECFEDGPSKRRGYEWFGGQAAPHEALTAYGLLEFRDMARVYDVDKAMLERTQRYLMSRKDGNGGFQRNARGLDQFGHAPADVTNAYIVWALTESGKTDDVKKELDALATQARTSKDPYFLGLVALSLINRDRTEEGIAVLKNLVKAQKEDGHLEADRTSITGSGGRDLQIETTALAVLGWLKANRPAEFNMATQKAIGWIGQQRGGRGAFGSTQSTILALKALIAYTRNNKQTAAPGEIKLEIAGKPAASLFFPAGAQDVMTLDVSDPEKLLHKGRNDVEISITGQNHFPYTLTWSYQTENQPAEPGCVVQLETQFNRATVEEGEAVHLNVTLQNLENHGQTMTVAIVGLPAGLTLPEDMKQLKDHVRLRENGSQPGLISAWEVRGRELILYWRELAPNQKIEVPIDLIARVPGSYTGPASRAYLYYNSDKKNWIKPLHVEIKPKAGKMQ